MIEEAENFFLAKGFCSANDNVFQDIHLTFIDLKKNVNEIIGVNWKWTYNRAVKITLFNIKRFEVKTVKLQQSPRKGLFAPDSFFFEINLFF